jgi:transcriptional regulator with XRE-family HTH domain
MKALNFAENLKIEMKNAKISQNALAKALNTTQATVSRWTSGIYEPDLQTVLTICEILDISPNVLLGWEE